MMRSPVLWTFFIVTNLLLAAKCFATTDVAVALAIKEYEREFFSSVNGSVRVLSPSGEVQQTSELKSLPSGFLCLQTDAFDPRTPGQVVSCVNPEKGYGFQLIQLDDAKGKSWTVRKLFKISDGNIHEKLMLHQRSPLLTPYCPTSILNIPAAEFFSFEFVQSKVSDSTIEFEVDGAGQHGVLAELAFAKLVYEDSTFQKLVSKEVRIGGLDLHYSFEYPEGSQLPSKGVLRHSEDGGVVSKFEYNWQLGGLPARSDFTLTNFGVIEPEWASSSDRHGLFLWGIGILGALLIGIGVAAKRYFV